MGDALIDAGECSDRLELAAAGRSLEIFLSSDDFDIATDSEAATLRLHRALPEALVSASLGRAVGDLVDHPLLRGRKWLVERAEIDGSETRIHFQTGMIAVSVPWAPGRELFR